MELILCFEELFTINPISVVAPFFSFLFQLNGLMVSVFPFFLKDAHHLSETEKDFFSFTFTCHWRLVLLLLFFSVSLYCVNFFPLLSQLFSFFKVAVILTFPVEVFFLVSLDFVFLSVDELPELLLEEVPPFPAEELSEPLPEEGTFLPV